MEKCDHRNGGLYLMEEKLDLYGNVIEKKKRVPDNTPYWVVYWDAVDNRFIAKKRVEQGVRSELVNKKEVLVNNNSIDEVYFQSGNYFYSEISCKEKVDEANRKRGIE